MENLTLSGLRDFDPEYLSGGAQERYLCPFCGVTKSRDDQHRSISANILEALWCCFRCDRRGKFGEAMNVYFSEEKLEEFRKKELEWRQKREWLVNKILEESEELSGEGLEYLLNRGISERYLSFSGIRWTKDYWGRPAVLFPIKNTVNKIVAIQGRYIDGLEPRMRTIGLQREGLFWAEGKINSLADSVIITEAPLDALSLVALGYTDVAASLGTRFPEPILEQIQTNPRLKVLIATDSDEAGEIASNKWRRRFLQEGIKSLRKRPPNPCKDWNEYLKSFS